MKHLLLTAIAAVVLVGCGPQPPDISIHEAAERGDIEAVKQHIAAGSDLSAMDGEFGGTTALHIAALYGDKELAELLIANGADVNAKNRVGLTPLHRAAENGHKEIAEQLIAKGADVNAKDDDGITALDLAKGESWEDPEVKTVKSQIAELLRKHGGKTGEELKAEAK